MIKIAFLFLMIPFLAADPAPELHSADVKKKIDTTIAEINKKIGEVGGSAVDGLKGLLKEAQDLSALFNACHQFLEAQKVIINNQITRVDTSINHTIKIAKMEEVMGGGTAKSNTPAATPNQSRADGNKQSDNDEEHDQ